MSEPKTEVDPDWSEPTAMARIAIEKAPLAAQAEFPADPAPRLIELVVYAIASVGAVLGPALTIYTTGDSTPPSIVMAVVAGQLGLLLAIVMVTRFRAVRNARR